MGQEHSPRFFGAGVLLLGTLAPFVCALAAGPEALPEELWWRLREPMSLRERPLEVLDGAAGVELTSEWSPLYRSRDGALVEGARRALRVSSPPGGWRAAAELERSGSAARGGGGDLWVEAESFAARRVTLALARDAGRLVLAGSLVAGRGERPGFGVAGRLAIAPGWRAEAGVRQDPVRGALDVRWEDARVHAEGAWLERAVRWRLAGRVGRAALTLGQEALDHVAERGSERDHLEPWLAWRDTRAAGEAAVLGARWTVGACYGEGRQGTRVRRQDATYAVAAGPVRRGAVSLSCAPGDGGLTLRAWAGRWSGDAAGTLALWPFETLAAGAGTRRVASSDASLAHRGLAVERRRAELPGWEAGLALWSLTPRAGLTTWQTTFLGLGRDDYSENAVTLRGALLAGLRLAESVRWGDVQLGLEAVQWLPVRVWEERAGGAGGGDGDGGSSAPASLSASARGGTVLRLSLRTGW